MAIERATLGWRGATAEARTDITPRPAPHRRRSRRVPRASTSGVVGIVIVLALISVALVGPFVVGTDPARQDLAGRLAPPLGLGGTGAHPLGTDALGHDVLARLVAGARISLLVGTMATLAAGVVGVTLGLVAGYAGGLVDRVITWVVDVQMAVPFVVVAITVTATLGNGLGNVVLTLALTGWVGYARVVRLQTRALRSAPWVEAARSLGVGPGRLVARHVLPNLAAPVVILASQQVAAMILYEAAFSYLGLGVGGDVVTWGGMVADGRDALHKAWWVATIPGAAIGVTGLGFNLLGDWLAVRGRARS